MMASPKQLHLTTKIAVQDDVTEIHPTTERDRRDNPIATLSQLATRVTCHEDEFPCQEIGQPILHAPAAAADIKQSSDLPANELRRPFRSLFTCQLPAVICQLSLARCQLKRNFTAKRLGLYNFTFQFSGNFVCSVVLVKFKTFQFQNDSLFEEW